MLAFNRFATDNREKKKKILPTRNAVQSLRAEFLHQDWILIPFLSSMTDFWSGFWRISGSGLELSLGRGNRVSLKKAWHQEFGSDSVEILRFAIWVNRIPALSYLGFCLFCIWDWCLKPFERDFWGFKRNSAWLKRISSFNTFERALKNREFFLNPFWNHHGGLFPISWIWKLNRNHWLIDFLISLRPVWGRGHGQELVTQIGQYPLRNNEPVRGLWAASAQKPPPSIRSSNLSKGKEHLICPSHWFVHQRESNW